MKGLYIVTPDWDDTAKMVEVTEKALKGGAEIVQYRHKTARSPIASGTGESASGCLQKI